MEANFQKIKEGTSHYISIVTQDLHIPFYSKKKVEQPVYSMSNTLHY